MAEQSKDMKQHMTERFGRSTHEIKQTIPESFEQRNKMIKEVVEQMMDDSSRTIRQIVESQVAVTSSEDEGKETKFFVNSEGERKSSDCNGDKSKAYSEVDFRFFCSTVKEREGFVFVEREFVEIIPSSGMTDSLGHIAAESLGGVVHYGYVQSVSDLIAEQVEQVENKVPNEASASEDEGDEVAAEKSDWNKGSHGAVLMVGPKEDAADVLEVVLERNSSIFGRYINEYGRDWYRMKIKL